MDYRQFISHRIMIRDRSRTEMFAKALETSVTPGAVVLDVGAGSGVLSLFAARAGAVRVYAVERTPSAAMARRLAHVNHLAHVIRVIQADIRTVSLPEKVDIIVSEWMGSIGVDENMFGAVLWARDHFLKPGGIMIPRMVTAFAAPVATSQRPDIGFFSGRPYGLDLSPLAEPSINELLMIRRRIDPDDLAAPAQVLWRSDAASDPPASVRNPYRSELKFTASGKHRVSALGAWFSADLAGDLALTNAPGAPDTHWGQLILPLERELEIDKGDTLQTVVEARAVGPGPLQFSWAVCLNDGTWERHDTMGAPGAAAGEPAAPADGKEPPRSALSRFLAALSLDPTLLSDFLRDPDHVMKKHGLPDTHRAALKSRNPQTIQQALYESEPAS